MQTRNFFALFLRRKAVWGGVALLAALGVSAVALSAQSAADYVIGAQDVFDQTLSVGALIAFQMLSGRVSGPLIALVGLENVVVVDTPDALLIADRGQAQEVRSVVSMLRDAMRSEYL